MQDPKTSKTRKSWYQRAMQMTTPWKSIFRKLPMSPTNSTTTINLWKTLKPNDQTQFQNNNNNNKQKLRKSTSMKVATSFTRVCLCAPISSYTEVFNTEVLPRRSYSYPRSSKPLPTTTSTTTNMPTTLHHSFTERVPGTVAGRLSVEGRRRVFRGKSLMDDVLMRRFVLEEEAMMQVRRRNEIEIIRKRVVLRRKRLGPSPLSRMTMAQDNFVHDFLQDY